MHALLAVGALLQGRYQVVDWIGGGGFANVYRVFDLRLGHVRALKEAYASDKEAHERFGLEADLLINSRHPNIPRGYNYFEEAGRLYLVMDYVEGQDLQWILAHYVRSTGAPAHESQIISWLLPICDAVEYMHQQRVPIIHRDIKPSNIKLTPHGIPMLIDFGLAKLAGRSYPARTAEGGFTPGYAPPEQAMPNGWTDARSDIYALGATLYHLSTGQVPTDALTRARGLREGRALLPPSAMNARVSPQFETVILRAMELDPGQRYQSVGELRAALLHVLTVSPAPELEPPRATTKLPTIHLSDQSTQPFANGLAPHSSRDVPTQPQARAIMDQHTQPLPPAEAGPGGVADRPAAVERADSPMDLAVQSDISTKRTVILDRQGWASSE